MMSVRWWGAAGVLVGALGATGCNESELASPAVSPIAEISGPETARATEVVEIDGSESYDPNAAPDVWPGISNYRWSIVSAPEGSQATIDGWRTGELATDLPGTYVVSLEVRDDNEHLWSTPKKIRIVVLPVTGFFAELTWNTDVNDVDLHLVNASEGGGLFDEELDCHWQNLTPDWGEEGLETDDPALSLDDVDGYGPEVAELAQPVIASQYQYLVHYFSDDGYGTTDATVKIYFNGELEAEMTRTLEANEVWDLGTIEWTGPSGVLNVSDSLSVY